MLQFYAFHVCLCAAISKLWFICNLQAPVHLYLNITCPFHTALTVLKLIRVKIVFIYFRLHLVVPCITGEDRCLRFVRSVYWIFRSLFVVDMDLFYVHCLSCVCKLTSCILFRCMNFCDQPRSWPILAWRLLPYLFLLVILILCFAAHRVKLFLYGCELTLQVKLRFIHTFELLLDLF